VSELVQIEVGDVDLEACKIFINRGKGAKDRYILFPASFRLVLKSHLHAAPRNRYLFETRRFGPFTTRRIQQILGPVLRQSDRYFFREILKLCDGNSCVIG
jgi:integrase/recombinase XerD